MLTEVAKTSEERGKLRNAANTTSPLTSTTTICKSQRDVHLHKYNYMIIHVHLRLLHLCTMLCNFHEPRCVFDNLMERGLFFDRSPISTHSRSSQVQMMPSTARISALDALLDEILTHISGFLLGWDMVRLSHASSRLLSLLSRDALWRDRVVCLHSTPTSAKLLYMQAFSIRFSGISANHLVGRKSLYRHGFLVRAIMATHYPPILTLDTWFRLLPASPDVFTGGVILYATTSERSPYGPFTHRQIVFVDRARNLYCSLTSSPMTPVATNLEESRWYHLAMSYDGHTQCVYLNGRLIRTETERGTASNHIISDAYVGVGWVPAGSVGNLTENTGHLYNFYGVIHEFRLWKCVMTGDKIHDLKQGAIVDDVPTYSLQQDASRCERGVRMSIRCSSPLEGPNTDRKSLSQSQLVTQHRGAYSKCIVQ